MKKIGIGLLMSALTFAFIGALPRPVLRAQQRDAEDFRWEDRDDIVTIDRFVPHISTSLANQGEQAHLFLREKVRRGGSILPQ